MIIIDEQLARELWPGQSALGRTLHIIRFDRQLLPREVVGVARHVQTQGLRSAGLSQIWMTYATRSPAQLNAVVRADAPLLLMSAIDRAAQRLGSGRPLRDGRLLSAVVADRETLLFRIDARDSLTFALAAMLLGASALAAAAIAAIRAARVDPMLAMRAH